MAETSAFTKYWTRKKLLDGSVPHFPVRGWRKTESLCDIEQIYLKALEGKKNLLDIGAGDLRIKNKLQKSGFAGEYHTQDISAEHSYTYSSLEQIKQTYEAIICLDVLEHMTFQEGIALIKKIDGLLKPGGVLILQTPNARCIRNPMAWDMTHLHCYNLPDLWALYTSQGYKVDGYRIEFQTPMGFMAKFYCLIGKFIITRLIGADYADNIALIAHKGAAQ